MTLSKRSPTMGNPRSFKEKKCRQIISHRGPLNHRDPKYQSSLYNVYMEWGNGEITEEPLERMIKEYPVEMDEYTRDNKILDLDGWGPLRPLAQRSERRSRLVLITCILFTFMFEIDCRRIQFGNKAEANLPSCSSDSKGHQGC